MKLERADGQDNVLLYSLKQDGWRKGQPIMVNDLMIRIENVNGSTNDLGIVADRITKALDLDEAERSARICEALMRQGVSPEKWSDYFRVREAGDRLLNKTATVKGEMK